jgi:hypothetical protein
MYLPAFASKQAPYNGVFFSVKGGKCLRSILGTENSLLKQHSESHSASSQVCYSNAAGKPKGFGFYPSVAGRCSLVYVEEGLCLQ